MNKIKSVISFIGNQKTTKFKIRISLFILQHLFEFPAFCFHELMHLIIICIYGTDLKILNKYFFKVEGNTLSSYCLTIQWSSYNKFISIIGGSAPLIGWFLSIILLILTHHFFILIYFILAFRMFFLSEMDIRGMHKCGTPRNIIKVLRITHKLLKLPRS